MDPEAMTLKTQFIKKNLIDQIERFVGFLSSMNLEIDKLFSIDSFP